MQQQPEKHIESTLLCRFFMKAVSIREPKRESLDCALALQELVNMGVSNIITFDAHDPRVQNAIPLSGFDNFMPTYQFLKASVLLSGF